MSALGDPTARVGLAALMVILFKLNLGLKSLKVGLVAFDCGLMKVGALTVAGST